MEMNQPIGRTPLDDRPDGLVGRPLDRVDGPLKVTGRAPYAYEVRELADPAYGFIVPATVSAGTIRAIDADAARRAPGVILVMTHENVPEQGEKKEQVYPQLQGPEIRFHGQPIAFVVARLLYVAFYIADRPTLRSLSWIAGFGLCAALFLSGS